MYQALYRKWRPKTFDDVVGQSHITDTLKQQVSANRPSHAYLFTGTRGTGKTTCAKILSRAVNCEAAENGNPCNRCPSCIGIENGSILDVLELDAASNNGVDQVRALRDEAVYTPAAVRKRVYIVDEVHMLSTPAFNALLKILEEPPPHLVFILATTELHKVPATIKSRCQQFSFKRILPGEIAQRLDYVAAQEGIALTREGSALLARLADGGMRDGLSLLDQCAGGGHQVDEDTILTTLGLAGNIETAKLMGFLAGRDTAGALETLAKLYGNGKDVGSVLSELASLSRDLLLRKTAPRGGAMLLTGGYDETTMRTLGEQFTAQRLLQTLTILQETTAALPRSSNRRTDAELALIRLSDETLDDSFLGLSARIARVEERLAQGIPVAQPSVVTNQIPQPAAVTPPPVERTPMPTEEVPWDEPPEQNSPPWDEEPMPTAPVAPRPVAPTPRPAAPAPRPAPPAPVRTAPSAAPASTGGDSSFWPSFIAGAKGKFPASVAPYLNNPAKVTGVWKNQVLTLWVDSEFTRSMLNKPAVLEGLAKAATASFGGEPRVTVTVGTPPADDLTAAPPPQVIPQRDAMDDLLDFSKQFDNIVIQ